MTRSDTVLYKSKTISEDMNMSLDHEQVHRILIALDLSRTDLGLDLLRMETCPRRIEDKFLS